MPSTPEFQKAYKNLNAEQKKAVDAIDGPVMVVAGPGTGKTQILALRIANILLKTDTAPDSILALTFTESGVLSMRKRLLETIGSRAHKINIFTFHGFCNNLIQLYPEKFPRILGAEAATELDQIQILENIIDSSKLEYLKPYGEPMYFLRPILSMIRTLKRENVSVEKFKKTVTKQKKEFDAIADEEKIHQKGAHKGKVKGEFLDLEKKIEKNAELALLFEAYGKKLSEAKKYDYEDMIVEAVKALEADEDFLLELQEKYQYLLADEHQDANAGQNAILELLANFHENPNIFIVGDEKQAIFRFQGASVENFLSFKKLYPGALVIHLVNNYRSHQTILDAAHGLIAHAADESSARQKLVAKAAVQADKKSPVLLRQFSKESYELEFLAEDIEQKIKSGISPSDIAVIYRENKDAGPVSRSLEKRSIPFVLQSDQNIFSDIDIQKLIRLFKVIAGVGNQDLLAELLYSDFLKFVPLDIHKFASGASALRMNVFDLLNNESALLGLNIEHTEALVAFGKKLSRWSSVAKNSSLLDVFEIILHESGFLDFLIVGQQSAEKMAKLDAIYLEAAKVSDAMPQAILSDFTDYIEALERHKVLVKAGTVGDRSGVRLMTAHRSKGLEFEYVYIVGLTDGRWGNKREIRYFHIPIPGIESSSADPAEDERRLLYVALTRAKRQAILSFAALGHNGEARLPSQFIDELDREIIAADDVSEAEKRYADIPEEKYAVRAPRPVPITEKKFLRELFLSRQFSPTALNTYLKCPWEYFWRQLIRVPETKTKHQLYGTAIHETLKVFFSRYAKGDVSPKSELIGLFKNNLRDLFFNESDYEESLARGSEALSGYYDAYKLLWPKEMLLEFSISNVGIQFECDGKQETLELRGILDKVEILGSGNEVNVVDYKTAKPKSRNAIMGNTKTESGDYFRQLCFYKLLLSNFDAGKYRMVSGEIDFIEPDEKGKYHKEKFEITTGNTEELLEMIQKTAKEICDLQFFGAACDEKDCEWCRLGSLLG